MATVFTVSSITPAHNATDVVKDVTIVVTFSKALSSASINTTNVRLYEMPAYASSVPISITVDPSDSTKLNIATLSDLQDSTQYQVLLLGDHATGDATLQGIYSTDGSILNGNQMFVFTTGTQTSVDVETEVSTSTESVPEYGTAGMLTNYVNVVATDPLSDARQVTNISEVTVRFDRNAYALSGSLSIATERLDQPFGDAVTAPTITDIDWSSAVVTWALSGDLMYNTVYTLTLDKDKVYGVADAEQMAEDYSWTFTSVLSPYYSTPYLVRMRGGFLVSGLSDAVIDRYIFQESVHALNMLGTDAVTTPTTTLTQLVTCLTVMAIAKGITLGAVLGVKEKQLADLRVVYDTQRMDRPLEDLQNCIDDALRDLGVDRGAQSGVKSYSATLRQYPYGRRRVFKLR